MLGSLAGFGLLALFTKEPGALLPIFVWVLETTLLPQTIQQSFFIWWRRLLYLPLGLLVGHMALQIPHIFENPGIRAHTPWQRLLTEGPILWRYVYLLLLPRASEYGPFHDDWVAVASLGNSPSALIAWLSWIALAGLAIVKRKRWPWLSFAIAWFLLGHALESSLFNLELYFEHRNYLPSVGILAAISAMIWQTPSQYRTTALGVTAVYALLLGLVLHEVTSAWGNARVASQLWGARHPESERAQQFLANNLLYQGDVKGALALLESIYQRHPERTGLGLQTIQLRCELHEDVTTDLQQILPLVRKAGLDHSMADTAEKLLALSEQKKCAGIDNDAVFDLIDALLENDTIRQITVTQFKLHRLKAKMFYVAGWGQPTIQELETAFNLIPDLETGILMIKIFSSGGFHDRAEQKIREIRQFLPNNPILKAQWLSQLDELERELGSSNRSAVTQ